MRKEENLTIFHILPAVVSQKGIALFSKLWYAIHIRKMREAVV